MTAHKKRKKLPPIKFFEPLPFNWEPGPAIYTSMMTAISGGGKIVDAFTRELRKRGYQVVKVGRK